MLLKVILYREIEAGMTSALRQQTINVLVTSETDQVRHIKFLDLPCYVSRCVWSYVYVTHVLRQSAYCDD